MDIRRFDDLARAMTHAPSRRYVLRGLASAGLGLTTARPSQLVEAKKKRKRKKHKPSAKPNEFGCLEVGDPCISEGDCCSGICEGKQGRRTCRAHDTGGCRAGASFSGCGGGNVECTTSLGESGFCATTTGNAGYCSGPPADYPCQTDVDCQLADGGRLGPRAACIRCDGVTGETLCATVAGTPS